MLLVVVFMRHRILATNDKHSAVCPAPRAWLAANSAQEAAHICDHSTRQVLSIRELSTSERLKFCAYSFMSSLNVEKFDA